jgi:hypothetical protein
VIFFIFLSIFFFKLKELASEARRIEGPQF